jgi:GTP:adenosylcobinamide-phosphate guanylyltransferase
MDEMNLPSAQPILDVTAVVLAGGKSSRMGRPKSLLLFDGTPLIVHLARALERMFAETVIVAAPEQELPHLPAILVRDEVAYQGPVGGIYYGLRAASGKSCFVTSCDVAFLNPVIDLPSAISNLRLRCCGAALAGPVSAVARSLPHERVTVAQETTGPRRTPADLSLR